MYLLDANVLSEMMKARDVQHPHFYLWTQEQQLSTLYLSSFSLSEIYQGIYALAEGKRRHALYRAIKGIEVLFEDAILDFDRRCAEQFGLVRARSKQSGLNMDMADSYFLAIAERYALTLVSRNVKHFEGRTQLEIVNPWAHR